MPLSRPDTEYPLVKTLWTGAVLGGIANAVMTAVDKGFAHYRQWIRNNYILNAGDGREGVITFVGGHWYSQGPLVGVFYTPHSSRNPFSPQPGWTVERAFEGAPEYQVDLAQQSALTYLELEVSGCSAPRVTTAFWDHGEHLAAADPWSVVLEHGADTIDDELIEDIDRALERAHVSYGMSDEQVTFVRNLYQRKCAHPPRRIVLTEEEVAWLQGQSADAESLELCSQLLSEMCIDVSLDKNHT